MQKRKIVLLYPRVVAVKSATVNAFYKQAVEICAEPVLSRTPTKGIPRISSHNFK